MMKRRIHGDGCPWDQGLFLKLIFIACIRAAVESGFDHQAS
jgi:hypothetical protein